MCEIYVAKAPAEYDEALFRKYSGTVERERWERVRRIRPDQSRMSSLLAGFLLQYGVKAALAARSLPEAEPERVLDLAYTYGEFGKPYLADYPELYFNLSHSGRFAVCAVSRREIGVDIQEEVSIEQQVAKRFFTASEYRQLQEITEPAAWRKLFFRLWTVKESYIKLSGMGLQKGLDSFRIDWEAGRIDDNERDGGADGRQTAWFRIWEEAPGVHLAVCDYRPLGAEAVKVHRVEIE